MNSNFEQHILNKIKKDGIKPTPRYIFVLKNISFYIFTLFLILFGGLFFSIFLYRISNNFFIFESVIKHSSIIFSQGINFIPYIWLLLLSLSLIISVKLLRKADLIYRYDVSSIILSILISMFIFGLSMFYFGIAFRAEKIIKHYIPFYENYSKIQKIKKSIFIKKLHEIGITEELLKENIQLKKKVQEKFNSEVLGKRYLYTSAEICQKDNIICGETEIFFQDNDGCGCREIYMPNLMK